MRADTWIKSSFVLLMLGLSSSASAVTCFFTFVKDSCWTDYNVTVNVSDTSNGKKLFSLTVPKGKSWGRYEFDCHESQGLNFMSEFSPIIWASDKGKTYSGKNSWTLPPKLGKGETAWNLTVCYPEEFSSVPAPPTAGNNCKCNNTNLPPVKAPKSIS